MMARPAISGGRSDGGYTLIEVVVALAIVSLLMAMMPGAFAIGQRAWDTIRRIQRDDDHAAARTFIEQRLTEAMPVLVADATGQRQFGFRGEPRRVAFIAPASSGPTGGGLYRFALHVESASAGDALILSQSQVAASPGATAPDAPRVLLEAAGGLRFRYFGQPLDIADRRWHDIWPQSDRLPELVELSQSPEDVASARSRFRTLIVALRLRRAT